MNESETITEGLLKIMITPRAASKIARGSLWVFSNEMTIPKPFPPAGTWCVFESDHKPMGFGYLNPHSLIAGRVVADQPGLIEDVLRVRLERAFTRRRFIMSVGSCRLCFSEADFIPGLIIDWYGGALVLQSNTAGIDSVLPLLESLVPAVYERVFNQKLKAFVIKADSGIRRLEGVKDFVKVVIGNENELKHWTVEEKTVLHAADLISGQKTGFFLDQRDNRAFLGSSEANIREMSVLDLYCYSGAWGLRALKEGAAHVTFVDESASAIDLVKQSHEKNGFPKASAVFVQSDAFSYLDRIHEKFDVVVCDPPAFVKSGKILNQAKKAYEKLVRLAWRRVARGGLLIFCSCSYHLPESDFVELVRESIAKEEGRAHVIFRGLQAKDHPILLGMPETAYLKCIVLRRI